MPVHARDRCSRRRPHPLLVLAAFAASVCLAGAAPADGHGQAAPGIAIPSGSSARDSSVGSLASPEDRSLGFGLPAHGLDLDDDYTTIVAGLPSGRPSHVHGEDHAPLEFVIPELVSEVRYRVGPSFVEAGDFAGAGATLISYRDRLPSAIVSVSGGGQGHRRAFGGTSGSVLSGTLLGALEVEQRDGPWTNPEGNRKLNGVLRYTSGSAEQRFEATALAYRDRWNATNQVPDRDVASGRISRYGAVDPSDGGLTHTLGLLAGFRNSGDDVETRLSGFLMAYHLDLFSDFTYFLTDTLHGDQIEQVDDRLVVGLHASRSVTNDWFAGQVVQTIGVDLRHDQIGTLGIFRTEARNRLGALREDRGRISSVSPYVEADGTWTRGLRTILGARMDGFDFLDEARDPSLSGSGVAGAISPKAAILLGPWSGFRLDAGAGYGIHTEDIRGAAGNSGGSSSTAPGVQNAVDHIPTGGGASSRTTPLLIRSRGADVGLQYSPDRSTLVAVSAWGLNMDSEHVFLGDQVTPARSRPSRRTGADLSARFDLGGAVHLDADASYTRARFTDPDPSGDRVPGAVEGVGSAGIEYSPGRGGHAGLRMRHVGPRPLTMDGFVRAPATTLWDAEVGFRWRGRWAALLEFSNVFDRKVSDAEYFYVSRLPGEPLAGVTDLHRHPEPPRTVRLTLSTSWPRPSIDQEQQRTSGDLETRPR